MKAKSIAQLAGAALVSITILAQPLSATNIKFMDRFGGDSRPAITQVYAEGSSTEEFVTITVDGREEVYPANVAIGGKPARIDSVVFSRYGGRSGWKVDHNAEYVPVTVKVDGGVVSFPDTQPIIINGRTLVPVRGVFEHLGWDVDWLPEQEAAVLKKGGSTIYVPIGQDRFMIDGKLSEPLDVPAQLIGGRTMLPLRAISEASGNRISWDGDGWVVAIMTEPDPILDAGIGNYEGMQVSCVADPGYDGRNDLSVTLGYIKEANNDLSKIEATRGYSVKFDLGQNGELFNYLVYEGEKPEKNLLNPSIYYMPIVSGVSDSNPAVAGKSYTSSIHFKGTYPMYKDPRWSDTGADDSIESILENFEVGQTVKVVTSVRNDKTGEVRSWLLTFEYQEEPSTIRSPLYEDPFDRYPILLSDIQLLN